MYIKKEPKQYAMYKGDECLAIGTVREIAEQMGVREETIYYYLSKTYERRLDNRKTRNPRIVIRIEDDE